MLNQRIHKRRITPEFSVIKPTVIFPNVFSSERFNNQYHHILLLYSDRIGRYMNRRINSIQLFRRKVIRYHKDLLADSTQQSKRSIQHSCRLNGTISILIGITNSYRTSSSSSTTSHSANT